MRPRTCPRIRGRQRPFVIDRTIWVPLLLVLACASDRGPSATQPEAAPSEMPLDAGPENQEPPQQALARLTASVAAASASPPKDFRPRLAAALLELGRSLDLLPAARGQEGKQVRDLSALVERDDQAGAGVVKDGLARARRALVGVTPPPDRASDYAESLVELARAIDGTNAGGELAKQRTSIIDALRAAANAVHLAYDQPPPFPAPTVAGSPPAEADETARLADARRRVLELGRASWEDARALSARALAALADVAAAAGSDRKRIATIRFQAERLEFADPMAFGHAGWTRTGLDAALDTLVQKHGSDGALSPWIDAARRAIAGIREHESIAFQRAAVQDAFRATLDAFVSAQQLEPRRSGDRDRGPE